ncbi:hypothetical protein BDY19DRAFT_1054988 [Irpex rosettiformis]|uniref:Uncharacterized protein n=1 Tax=Irpex rosettiformis TaxID=378272 RepID=A0ACB8UBJ8_9APHY|nr:hypothetical protein BDY19DRAFT_1054988 [Irpex rosettiformis]
MSSSSVLDRLKPQRAEALARIRTNGVGFFALLITTNLLPLPGPWEAIWQVWQSYNYRLSGREEVTLWWLLCFAELIIIATLAFNILQGIYALQFPPKALLPLTPATPRPNPLGMDAKSPKTTGGLSHSQRKLIASTPTTVPQPQKPFSSSFYPSTPVSSPSRILNYSTLSQADTSINSSISSLQNSPSPAGGVLSATLLGMSIGGSPSLAAYRGKHKSGVGRAFDGELLTRLSYSAAEDEDD